MVLEQTIGDMSSCGMEVLQAYLHFEALQSHECPSLLITDLYQKGILNMAGVHLCVRGDMFTVLYLQQKRLLNLVDIFHNLVVNSVFCWGCFFLIGIEIQSMPEPFTGEVNAEEIWDSVCTEIITSGLNARECDLESND